MGHRTSRSLAGDVLAGALSGAATAVIEQVQARWIANGERVAAAMGAELTARQTGVTPEVIHDATGAAVPAEAVR